MENFKAAAGYLPGQFINWILARKIARHKRATLVDFVNSHPKWFRSVHEHILVETEFDFSMYCDRRSGIGQMLIADGQWERLLSRTLLARLKVGDTAIDVGANIGYDTILMCERVGPAGLVFAFEPVAGNLALLLRNIDLGEYRNVVVQSLALSDSAGVARILVSDEYNSGKSNLRSGEIGRSQPTLTARLESLLNREEISRIAFIKVDVEGFEFKVIQGIGQLIDRVDCLSCEVNPNFLRQCGSNPEAIFKFMWQKGFTSLWADSLDNRQWDVLNHDFDFEAFRGDHFDALFCRDVDVALGPLIRRLDGS